MAKQRTTEAAAHKPHGRRHRGRDVLLEVDTTRNGLPFWLRREKEIYLAGVQNRIEAARRAVREPPKGDVDPAYFSTATPWLVPKPRRATRVPDPRKEAEKRVKAAERAEKRNPARASILHEKAGDLFRGCRTEGCCPLMPSGAVVDTFEAALPDPEEYKASEGRTMYEEAIRHYRKAADLVRKTNPERAEMLERRIDATVREMRDEEDGISRDE